MTSLHSEIEPTFIRLDPEQTGRLFVRSLPGQATATVESLQAMHAQLNPSFPFEYRFLDE
jgi:hypothetical protein